MKRIKSISSILLIVCMLLVPITKSHAEETAASQETVTHPESAFGWVKQDNNWYLGDSLTGQLKTGWVYTSGAWYYFDPISYDMKSGWQLIDGTWYYLGTANDGSMKSGWQYIDGNWFYLGITNDGSMKTGWQLIDGKWYYMNPDGVMQTGWQQINESWYYLGDANDGAMKTGWLSYYGNWYYLGDANDGAMKTGWQMIDGLWFYMYENGIMACNTYVDGYYISAYGAWVDNTAATATAQQYASSTNYLILVDTKTCMTYVFGGMSYNWSMLYAWQCAPGTDSSPTVKGEFTVGAKGYYFDKTYCRCYYYTQFYGNYLFHSVLYNKSGELIDGRVGVPLSHGCVRLQIENAKWIYDNIPVNTKVVVY